MEFSTQGKNVLFEINDGLGFRALVCAKNFSLQVTSELIEVTTLTTGQYKDFELQSLDYTINLSSVFIFETSNVGGGYLYNQQAVGGKMPYKITFTDDNNSVFIITGTCIVESTILNASPGDVVGSDFVLRGCGEPAYSSSGSIDPADSLKHVFYIATGGETFLSQVDWIGADIIDVERNGISLIQKTTGTPTSTNEFVFDAVAGSLTFVELGAEEYIHIIYAT